MKNSKDAASNRDSNGRFLPGTHWRKHSIFREKEYLQEQYWMNGKSALEIAQENGVTENAILFWMYKLEIPRRSMSECRKIKRWGCRGNKNPMYGRYGNKNPRFIDGSSPERQTMYARSFWKEIARKVYERDGHKCVRCGSKIKLHAHHIKPWAGNKKYRFMLENVVALCRECHKWVHSKRNIEHEYLSS